MQSFLVTGLTTHSPQLLHFVMKSEEVSGNGTVLDGLLDLFLVFRAPGREDKY